MILMPFVFGLGIALASLILRLSDSRASVSLVSAACIALVAIAASYGLGAGRRFLDRASHGWLAVAAAGPLLGFGADAWSDAISTPWRDRIPRGGVGAIWSWPQDADPGGAQLFMALGCGVLGAMAYLLSGRMVGWLAESERRLGIAHAAAMLSLVVPALALACVAWWPRGAPPAHRYVASLPVVAEVFSAHESALVPAASDEPVTIAVGGLRVERRCIPSCNVTLGSADERAGSCTLPAANIRVPVVLRRDDAHGLWFLDDGTDALAYRARDLQCVDVSTKDLVGAVRLSRGWLVGPSMGLGLGLLAQVLRRLAQRRLRRSPPAPGTGGEEHAGPRSALLASDAFTLAVALVTVPPIVTASVLGMVR